MTVIDTTSQLVKNLEVGDFARLERVNPAGSLEARRLANGSVIFYWRVTLLGAKRLRVKIGHHDSGAAPKSLLPTAKGYSIAAARRKAEELASEHMLNIDKGGHAAVIAAGKEAKAKVQAAADAAQQASDAAGKHTVANLLDDYAGHFLQGVTQRDVRSIFNRHVVRAWPKEASQPASELTSEQVADMMRKLIEAGKDRTANKLRAYMRSGYQWARSARSNPAVPLRFKAYAITSNPVADTQPNPRANRADKNPLSGDEMRAYWQAIEQLPDFKGAVLRLHLLTGAQRQLQLVRLKVADIRGDSIRLFDSKGRPGKGPREHVVPLLPLAAEALQACLTEGTYALSLDAGASPLAASTLSDWACEAGAQITGFQTKRLRSGVETLLASARVSRETRGHLQSHGVGGVQTTSYDAHDYMDVKREALETLLRLLQKPPVSNVLPFGKPKAA